MTDGPRCRGCRRPIRTTASLALGYGRQCAEDRGLIAPRRPRTLPDARKRPTAPGPDQTAIPIQLEITT